MVLHILFWPTFFYALIVFTFYFFQESFVFIPEKKDFFDTESISRQRISPVISNRQPELRYYLHLTQEAKGWIIFFHGNAGSATDRPEFVDGLEQSGFNFVLVEYPGYANDRVAPSEKRILENALLIFEEIQDRNTDNLPIVVYGESLGTGVATYVAAKKSVQGLILHSPYPSLFAVGAYRFPFLPVYWLLKHPFQAENWAKSVTCPVLALHGQVDTTIPLKLAVRQAQKFRDLRELHIIPGANHADLIQANPGAYWHKINTFLTHLGDHSKKSKVLSFGQGK